jgi:hypothetical protein
LPVRNHLAVRDTLRANTALRDEYTATKQALVKDTTTLYFKGKRALVMRIIEVSGRFTPKEMEALGVQDLTRTARKVKKVKKRVEEVKAEEAEVEEEKDTIAAEKHDATDPNDTVEEKGAINVGGATEPNDGADPKATVPDEIVLVVSAVEVKTISDPCSCEPNDPPEAEDAPFSKIATGAPDAN